MFVRKFAIDPELFRFEQQDIQKRHTFRLTLFEFQLVDWFACLLQGIQERSHWSRMNYANVVAIATVKVYFVFDLDFLFFGGLTLFHPFGTIELN